MNYETILEEFYKLYNKYDKFTEKIRWLAYICTVLPLLVILIECEVYLLKPIKQLGIFIPGSFIIKFLDENKEFIIACSLEIFLLGFCSAILIITEKIPDAGMILKQEADSGNLPGEETIRNLACELRKYSAEEYYTVLFLFKTMAMKASYDFLPITKTRLIQLTEYLKSYNAYDTINGMQEQLKPIMNKVESKGLSTLATIFITIILFGELTEPVIKETMITTFVLLALCCVIIFIIIVYMLLYIRNVYKLIKRRAATSLLREIKKILNFIDEKETQLLLSMLIKQDNSMT